VRRGQRRVSPEVVAGQVCVIMTASIDEGSTPNRFMAMSEDAPQSRRKLVSSERTWMQVWSLPPLPKVSPLPKNRTSMLTITVHSNRPVVGVPLPIERPRSVIVGAWGRRRTLREGDSRLLQFPRMPQFPRTAPLRLSDKSKQSYSRGPRAGRTRQRSPIRASLCSCLNYARGDLGLFTRQSLSAYR